MTYLGLLLAIGVVISYGESVLLPLAFIAPGVKLGLANTIGLIVLYYFGLKEYVSIGFLRVILTALFTGFGFNFFYRSGRLGPGEYRRHYLLLLEPSVDFWSIDGVRGHARGRTNRHGRHFVSNNLHH